MIFDNISNKDKYKDLPEIYKVLCHLADAKGLPNARAELGESFVNPVTLTTKPVRDCRYEAHKKYIDIHFILEGVEGISVSDVDTLTPVDDFDFDKDIGFFDGVAQVTHFLTPGDFMVCLPQDAHRVAMGQDDIPTPVAKLVGKVPFK